MKKNADGKSWRGCRCSSVELVKMGNCLILSLYLLLLVLFCGGILYYIGSSNNSSLWTSASSTPTKKRAAASPLSFSPLLAGASSSSSPLFLLFFLSLFLKKINIQNNNGKTNLRLCYSRYTFIVRVLLELEMCAAVVVLFSFPWFWCSSPLLFSELEVCAAVVSSVMRRLNES